MLVTDEAAEDDRDQVYDLVEDDLPEASVQVRDRTGTVLEPEAGPWLPGPKLVEDVEVGETSQTSSK